MIQSKHTIKAMEGSGQNVTVKEPTNQNVNFTRFLHYFREECGYVVPTAVLNAIPSCDGPIKLSLKTFFDVLRKLRTALGRNKNYGEDGGSLLHVAVVENMPEYANYLITVEKININSRNIEGETALSMAIRMERKTVIDILLAANCDVTLANPDQVTPLHVAVNLDDTKVSLRLIQAGADINAQDSDGYTPLHWAIISNAVETLCMLLFFNADTTLPRYDGLTPFMFSIYTQNHEIQDILIDYVVDFNACAWDVQESTILSMVLNGDGYLLQDVFDRGVDLDQSILFKGMLEAVNNQNMDIFRIIWIYFEPDETFQWNLLEQIEINLQTPTYMIVVLRTILESGKLEPLFVNFDIWIGHLCRLLFMGEEMKVIVEQLMLTYVAYGYQLDSETIAMMYYMGGYSKFLEILLHMEIDLKPEPMPNTLSSVLTHIDISMAEFKTKFSRVLIIDSNLMRFITFEPEKVPSLLELARDASRDYLVKKFKLVRTRDYYFLVKNLPICATFKDILTFKKCIYSYIEGDDLVEVSQMVHLFPCIKQIFIRNPRS